MNPCVLNHAKGVYIINAKHCISSKQSFVYHQAAEEYTLARDDIQGRLAALDDIPTCVGLYAKPAAWIKNDKILSNFVVFWPARKDLNLRPSESESDALSSCATGRYIKLAQIILYHNKSRNATQKIKKFKIAKKILQKALTNGVLSVIISSVNGVSPSGKATDSDSVIT